MKIVIASNNAHKIGEFEKMLENFEILSLKDIGFFDEIDETGETFAENAKIKAETVFAFCKREKIDACVIADDSGLCVDALGGAPGVFSARYAGNHDDEANRQKLLRELDGVSDRSAHFECAICFVCDGDEQVFVGKTHGKITEEKRGSDSFGYDCLFFSLDLDKTFGEATAEEKASVSHRGRAISMLLKYLKNKRLF